MDIKSWGRPVITTITWYATCVVIIVLLAMAGEFSAGPCAFGIGFLVVPLLFFTTLILAIISAFKGAKRRGAYLTAAYIHAAVVLGITGVFAVGSMF